MKPPVFNPLALLSAAALFAAAGTVLPAAEGAPDELRGRALSGDGQAQLALAEEFFFGHNRPGNLTLAAYWYRRCAEQKQPEGEYNLGGCYEHGWGVEKSLQRAFVYYSLAAGRNFAPAITRRALLLYAGVPAEDLGEERFPEIPSDRKAALAELRRAASGGYAPAQLALALKLFDVESSRREHAEEIGRLARNAAAAPDAGADAVLFYAECLRRGVGMRADAPAAAKEFGRAAKLGAVSAKSRLALMLEFGMGIPADPGRAIELYREAAEGGDPAGMTGLGDHYLTGDHVSADPFRAHELYARAVAAEYPPAFAKLGDCLIYGVGTETDKAAAFNVFERGAKLGDAEAQYKLAGCYADGVGTVKDPAAAVFWFKCAGAAGHRGAVRELGLAFLNGRGVASDPAEGRRLLEAAAGAGDRRAAEWLEKRP